MLYIISNMSAAIEAIHNTGIDQDKGVSDWLLMAIDNVRVCGTNLVAATHAWPLH